MKLTLNSQTGLSLLEVIIALLMIGVILLFYQAGLTSVVLARNAKNQEIALRIANNKIEELRAGGYAALPSSGSFSDPQLNTLSNSAATMTVTDFDTTTKKVLVIIQWRESMDSFLRNISLATLITKTGGM